MAAGSATCCPETTADAYRLLPFAGPRGQFSANMEILDALTSSGILRRGSSDAEICIYMCVCIHAGTAHGGAPDRAA